MQQSLLFFHAIFWVLQGACVNRIHTLVDVRSRYRLVLALKAQELRLLRVDLDGQFLDPSFLLGR